MLPAPLTSYFRAVKTVNDSTSSKVFMCEVIRTERTKEYCHSFPIVAVKVFSKQLDISEVVALKAIRHVNVLRFLDFFEENAISALITEYAASGDLRSFLQIHRNLASSLIKSIVLQICMGLQAIHNANIIHRDLKPSNILLVSTTRSLEFTVKIGDFGVSKVLSKELQFTKTFVGTPYYVSPEIINGSYYGQKTDIWALGCVIYEVAEGVPPFLAAGLGELYRKIVANRLSFVKVDDRNLQCLIKATLQSSASGRPDVNQLFDFAYLRMCIQEFSRQAPVSAEMLHSILSELVSSYKGDLQVFYTCMSVLIKGEAGSEGPVAKEQIASALVLLWKQKNAVNKGLP